MVNGNMSAELYHVVGHFKSVVGLFRILDSPDSPTVLGGDWGEMCSICIPSQIRDYMDERDDLRDLT